MYELRPCDVIISLGNLLYRIPEIAPPTATSLITTKKCSKLISQTRKLIFCLVWSQSKGKIVATSMTPVEGSSKKQQNQMDMVMKAYRNFFSSPTRTSLHYQVRHSLDLTQRAPLPNGSIYHYSILEYSKYKQQHDQHQVSHKFQVGEKF